MLRQRLRRGKTAVKRRWSAAGRFIATTLCLLLSLPPPGAGGEGVALVKVTPTKAQRPTQTRAPARTHTPTRTHTSTRTHTATKTRTSTRTNTATKTNTPTKTETATKTQAPTKTPTRTKTATITRPTTTPTPADKTGTATRTATRTATPSQMPSQTATLTPLDTPSPSPSNLPPSFTSEPPATAPIGEVYRYRVTATDPDGDAITFALVEAPSGMDIDPVSGVILWLPSLAISGPHAVTVEARDPLGAAATQSYVLMALSPNLRPIITSAPPRSVKVGESYSYPVEAYDPEGEGITFELGGSPPAGMAIHPQTGLLTWLAVGPARQERISVRARDASGGEDAQVYDLNVVDEPLALLAPAGTFEVAIGTELTLALQANYPQAGFSVEPPLPGSRIDTGTFRFTPTAAQEGEHALAFIAHLDSLRASNVVLIRVTRTNQPPSFAPIPPQQVSEGRQLTFRVDASDPDGDSLLFTAPDLSLANAFFNQITRQFLFRPAFGQAGAHTVRFQVSDGIDAAIIEVPIQVVAVAPPAEVLDLVVDEPANPSFATSQSITGSVRGQAGPPPPPSLPRFLSSLSPASAAQGASALVEITGFNTNFAAGSTAADFGAGVVVESIEVSSPTSARAAVRVSEDAEPGVRHVRLTQAEGDVYSVVAFVVNPGTASVAGRVIDEFTGQPLSGARVGINGSPAFTLTEADGSFLLGGVPPGEHTLVVTLANHSVQKIGVVVGANQQVTLSVDVGLNALARPPAVGGVLPRAATVASVLDRGVGLKGGGLTFEQAKAVVQDTMIAVGGIEAGVIDEAGNQLNPRLGDSAGELSLTQEGVARHAETLMLGDVVTVREFADVLLKTFSFPLGLTAGEIVDGFQRAVDEAWANPADPSSAMAIVLFSDARVLSPAAPRITLDTRLNRFQVFLLMSSFLVFNRGSLERSIENILTRNGIDYGSQLVPSPFPHLAHAVRPQDALPPGAAESLLARVSNLIVSAAYAQGNPDLDSVASLSARQTFTKVWRTVGANAIAEAQTGAAVSGLIAAAMQATMAFTIGLTGGRLGVAVAVMTVGAAAMAGFSTVLFQKLVLGWYIALVAASLEPGPPQGRQSYTDSEGNFVIQFDRSPEEVTALTGPARDLARKFTYHLFRVPGCGTPVDQKTAEYIPLEAEDDYTHPSNRQEPAIGPKQFVVPQTLLKAGVNNFRVRAFQYLHNSQEELVEGFERFDSDQNGMLSYDEFRNAGFGDAVAFGAKDRNGDLQLDPDELQIESNAPRQLKVTPDVPGTTLGTALGHPARSPQQYQTALAAENADIETLIQAGPNRIRQNFGTLRNEYGKLTPAELEFFAQNLGAFGVADDTVQAGIRSAPDTAHLTKAEADAQVKAQAQALANDLYGRHLNTTPTAAQVALVEEVMQVQRDIHVGREQIKVLAFNDKAINDAIKAVQSGQASSVDVELKFFQSDSLQLDARRTTTITIDPSTVADVELDFKTPPFESINQGRFSDLVDWRLHAMGTVGATSEAGGSIVISGRRNAAGTAEALWKDALKVSSGAPEAELDAKLTSFKNSMNKIEARGLVLTRKSLQQRDEITKFIKELRKVRNIGGALPSSRLGPNIARPAGLSPVFEKAIGRGGELGGAVVGASQTLLTFLENVRVLSSEFSEACFTRTAATIPVPTEKFPPSFEPHPNGEEVSAIVREVRTGAKQGFLQREYPGDDAVVSPADAGFPPAFLTIDGRGRIYALNSASNERFGGRIFRYEEDFTATQAAPNGEPVPFSLTRELAGSTTYFNLNIQLARPALPVAMTVGPTFIANDENGSPVSTYDLFMAHIDIIDGEREILQVPVHRIDTIPSVYGPGSGFRHQLVGQPIIVSDDLKLTGPSDFEVGPDVAFARPESSSDSVLVLSDEDSIFVIEKEPPTTGAYVLRRIIQVAGRRWSGMAFDKLGNFYFADYARGDVFVMSFTRFRTGVLTTRSIHTPFITDEAALAAAAFPIARGIEQPGDVELMATSSYPGGVLNVSTFKGILPLTLPVIGRLDGAIEVRANLFGIERAAELDAANNFFHVTPSREDHAAMAATLRVKRLDAQGRERWDERVVLFSEHGATIIEGSL